MYRYRYFLIPLLLWLGLNAAAQGAWSEEELLLPDQAFQISGRAGGDDKLIVEWRIADGYYMYRDKIRFETDDVGFELDSPTLSEAKIKHDEFFGDVAIYRNRVSAEIPLRRMQGAGETLLLKARSQGCADQGICFPPHEQQIRLALAPQSAQPAALDLPLQSVNEPAEPIFASNEGEGRLLDPEEAYILTVEVEDARHLRLNWQIAEGTYLYHDSIELSLPEDPELAIGAYQLPEPEIKEDSIRPDGSIGDVAIYHDGIDLSVPLSRSAGEPREIELTVKYQGCAEIGVCYPPISKALTLPLPGISEAQASEPPGDRPAKSQATTRDTDQEPLSELEETIKVLQSGSTLLIIGFFYVFGLGLAFTPCIYPMIPILSGIIAGQGATITTSKAFTLSLVYVLSMALTYTIAGVLAGLFGGNLQAYFQDPWILSAFALLFVLLALSMFGFYDLQLPSSLQSKLTEISNRQASGSLVGVAVMGFLSALIVGPCVAPPLAGALIYIGQTGDAQLGGLALFALSLGMGTPLVAIGTSAGKLLPRAGGWMDTVKAVFGVAMLGVAIILLERIIPAELAMALWGILFIVSAIYMGALRHLEIEASGWEKLWKGLGVVFLVYGALMLVGAAAGGKDTLQPLRGIAFAGATGGDGASHSELRFTRIKSVEDLQREVAEASARGQSVMLDFYADWCVSCKEMEKYSFSDPAVIEALAETRLLQADVTANDEIDRALLQSHFGLPGPPAIIFYGSDGLERKRHRVVGFLAAEEFVAHVRRALR
ncbi:MAG: protein-disulfide reductase DsbD [Candidatus Thiodiazotropha sp.]